LNLADCNFSTRTLTLQNAMDGGTNDARRSTTKEDDIRVRRVSDRLAEWLERPIPKDRHANGLRPLFVNPRARTAPGGRFNSQALRNIWKSAATQIGFPQVSPYEGSKHSTLTAARRAGANDLDVGVVGIEPVCLSTKSASSVRQLTGQSATESSHLLTQPSPANHSSTVP
jgi:hypothetical protein